MLFIYFLKITNLFGKNKSTATNKNSRKNLSCSSNISKSTSCQLMQETPQHSLQESVHFTPCLQYEHVIVLHSVLELQQIILIRFGAAGDSVIVIGIILPF